MHVDVCELEIKGQTLSLTHPDLQLQLQIVRKSIIIIICNLLVDYV